MIYLFCVPWMFTAGSMGIGSFVCGVSCHEIKCWTSGTFDLLVALDEDSGNHQIHLDKLTTNIAIPRAVPLAQSYNTVYRCYCPSHPGSRETHPSSFLVALCKEEYFNNMFHSDTSYSKTTGTNMKSALVEHICRHVV